MMYKVGDEVVVIIYDTFGYGNIKNDRMLKLQVIGIDSYELSMNYLCYVPHYMNHPHSNKLDDYTLRRYKVDKKFLGEQCVSMSVYEPVARHIPCATGEKCDRCQEFIPGGIRQDFIKFHCRNCRENPWRLFVTSNKSTCNSTYKIFISQNGFFNLRFFRFITFFKCF